MPSAPALHGDIETQGGLAGYSQSGLRPYALLSPASPTRRHAEKRTAGSLTDTGLVEYLMTPRAQDITLIGSESASRSHMALRAFQDRVVNEVPFSPRSLDSSRRFAFPGSPQTLSCTIQFGGSDEPLVSPGGFSKQPLDLRDMQLPNLASSTPEPANLEALEARLNSSTDKYAGKRKLGPTSPSEIDRLGGLVNHMFTPPPQEKPHNISHTRGVLSDEGGLANFQTNLPAYYPSSKGYVDPLIEHSHRKTIPENLKGELTLDGGLNKHLVMGAKELPEGYIPALGPAHPERRKPEVEKAYFGALDEVGGIAAHFSSPVASPPPGYLSPLPGYDHFKRDRFPLDKAHQLGNIVEVGGLTDFLNTIPAIPSKRHNDDASGSSVVGEIDRAGSIYNYETLGSPKVPDGFVPSITDPTLLRRHFENPVLHKGYIDKFGLAAYAHNPTVSYSVGAEDHLMHSRDATTKIVNGRVVAEREHNDHASAIATMTMDGVTSPEYKRTTSLRELTAHLKKVDVEHVREVPIRSGRIGSAALVTPCQQNDAIPNSVDKRVVSMADVLRESQLFQETSQADALENLSKTFQSLPPSNEYSLTQLVANEAYSTETNTPAVVGSQLQTNPETNTGEVNHEVRSTPNKTLTQTQERELVKSLFYGTKPVPQTDSTRPGTAANSTASTSYRDLYAKQRSRATVAESPNVRSKNQPTEAMETPKPRVDATPSTLAKQDTQSLTPQCHTSSTSYQLVSDDDLHRLARVRKTIREMLPKKGSSAAALLRRKLVLKDTDNDGFITDLELYQVLSDLAPGVSVSDVGFLTKFLDSEGSSKSQQLSAGYSSSQVVEWITSNAQDGLLERSRMDGKHVLEPAPESTRSDWQGSNQKWNEFRVQWEHKHGKPASKELAMDAAEPKVGPTWTRSAPQPFKVLHLAQRAPLPSPSTIPTE